jgi:flagellar biosynthesis/type III secretory pathway protein FliH
MDAVTPDVEQHHLEIYHRGYNDGRLAGYREGYAEAMKRAHEMVERTLGPLTERREAN